MSIKAFFPMACLIHACISGTGLAQEPEGNENTQGEIEDFSNKTILFDSKDTGYGVQYFAPDGRTYLWFPGQLKIAIGTWSDQSSFVVGNPSKSPKSHQDFAFRKICFEFSGVPRAQIVTKSFGPKKCFHVQEYFPAVQEFTDGDFLSLASGQIPCRICPTDRQLSRLKK